MIIRHRVIALFVLALLGAPMALHVVTHDLHHHHDQHPDELVAAAAGHGDHEHPVVGSAAPGTLRPTQAGTPAAAPPQPVALTSAVGGLRNVLSLGAIRIDDDVGAQPLLSTWII